MAIFAIIGTVVIPAFLRAAAPNNALAAAEPVVQLLKSAQQVAAQQDVPVTVLIDPTTASYRAAAESQDTVLDEGTLALPGGTRLQTDSLRARFVFEPTGGVVGDSLFVISSAGVVLLRPDPWGGTIDVVQ
jgi:Tfp pilus assembly protein FimT